VSIQSVVRAGSSVGLVEVQLERHGSLQCHTRAIQGPAIRNQDRAVGH